MISVLQKQLIRQLLQKICHFSYIGHDSEAFRLITLFSFSPIIRCLAINRVVINSGEFLGEFFKVILSKSDKLFLFKQTNVLFFGTELKKYFLCVKGRKRYKKTAYYIPFMQIKNIILQSQLCFLLDAFYEGKYDESMHGFRKGRDFLQVVGCLYKISNFTHKIKDSNSAQLFVIITKLPLYSNKERVLLLKKEKTLSSLYIFSNNFGVLLILSFFL